MPIEIKDLVSNLRPERTVLFFGAGSSIPSNAPTSLMLQQHFERQFGVGAAGYTLAEQTGLIEYKTKDRPRLIKELRHMFRGAAPTGALLNLPLYQWKSIFTTNYDKLIETAYERKSITAYSYSSNFDFGIKEDPRAVQIFKLHGTIDKDVSDGDRSRIILTTNDYDLTHEFREQLYDRFKADIAGNHLIIIGHSLADPDIRADIDRALAIINKAGGGGTITIFIYTRDEGRAALLESRGLSVCFGGLDDFFAGLVPLLVPSTSVASMPATGDPLDHFPQLRPTTIDTEHDELTGAANIGRMINGWPASYADIAAGYAFSRNVADQLAEQLRDGERPIAILLGPSGVGKTTAARQAIRMVRRAGFFCWEHKADHALSSDHWRNLAAFLKSNELTGVLLIDDAHSDLSDVNELIDSLVADDNKSLALILVSSANHWYPRVKATGIHKLGKEYLLNQVANNEIDRLLNLAESVTAVRDMVEDNFAGYSRPERRRRLVERCEADMFVCLKNIFSTDSLDDIMLREYATLPEHLQDVYKVVAAMEAAGVRVHRQLVIRLLGIPPMHVSAVLVGLMDIINEQTVDEREGVYAWKGRHTVIMTIIAEHKYYHENKRFDLFSNVIDCISPTYDIEIRTIRELCNVEAGLATISDKRQQNILLRKMISAAPAERVPRHRLLRNLISLGEYDQADTEIKLFEKDFGLDGPATRYRINLSVARAIRSPGLLDEDRIVLLDKAIELASASATRFRYNKAVLTAYCEAGLEFARFTRDKVAFDEAMALLRKAEDVVGDTDITRRIAGLDGRMRRIERDGTTDWAIGDLDDD